jgi:hypothetical protein
MTWNDAKRAYHFGCECSPGLALADWAATGCMTGAAADAAFLARYCAPDQPGITGTAARLKDVPIKVARCVISKLTELVPTVDHSTPGWSWSKRCLPAIVIGHLGPGLRIRSPRCGLWADAEKLYFWADKRAFTKPQPLPDDWVEYGKPDDAGRRPMLRYPEPLKCICGGGDDVVLPGPVVEFLLAFKAIAVASEWRDGPLAPWDVYDALDTGETPPFDKDEDARADVPNDQDRDVSHHAVRLYESEDPNEVGSTKSSAVESPKIAQKKLRDCDVTWLGFVYLDENNSAKSREMPLKTAQEAWPDHLPQPQKIIFMGVGPKSGISIIADDIRSLYASLSGNIPAIAPPTAAHYIYVYHEQPSWQGVFYVGKGKKRRYLSHLNEAFQIIASNKNRRVHTSRSSKVESIERYLRQDQLSGGAQDPVSRRCNISRRYDMATKQPASEANPVLVRILHDFSTHEGLYGDVRSQAAEKFLINFHYGVYKLTNKPAGNDPEGFAFLVRPAWYGNGSHSEGHRWDAACRDMIKEGRLDPLRKTKLDLPSVHPFITSIDQGLAALNVLPVRFKEGEYGHLKAAGAGDFLLHYAHPKRPYGINIRLRRSEPKATMGLCRGPKTSSAAFTAYILQHAGLTVTRPGSDPYFRPFKRCGAANDQNVVFGIGDRQGAPAFTFIDIEPNGHAIQGADGCQSLNIFQAVKEILNRFR